jgi:hypothetical protein
MTMTENNKSDTPCRRHRATATRRYRTPRSTSTSLSSTRLGVASAAIVGADEERTRAPPSGVIVRRPISIRASNTCPVLPNPFE